MTFKFSLAAVTLGALTLSACAPGMYGTGDPAYERDKTRNGALAGAVLGAAAGVAVGDDEEERRRGAAIGALVGAGAGAAIGAQLDRQEAKLRAQLDANGTQIVNTGDSLVVTMPQNILFATDSYAVRADLQDDLRAVASSLQRYPNSVVDVVGHTDNTGEAAYNQQLSQRRAQAVASVLTRSGVAGSRVRVIGRGEDQPIASNLTPDGRAQNRRVEIIIRPTQ